MIYFAADHTGFELKNTLMSFVRDQVGYEVEDCGAYEENIEDDYPQIVATAARHVSQNPTSNRAIVLGASGQGEAIVANRFQGVRAVVYYGEPSEETQTDASGKQLSLIASTREHNDANVLSLGARFLSVEEAKRAVRIWLETSFPKDARHVRRINQIEGVANDE